MSRIKAYIESIIYHNSSNDYTVMHLACGSENFTAVGYISCADQGDTIEAEGEFTEHPIYGRQFSISSFSLSHPDSADQIERYLAGGAIKGIGYNFATLGFSALTFFAKSDTMKKAGLFGLGLSVAWDFIKNSTNIFERTDYLRRK